MFKKITSTIPFNRLIVYLIALGLLPLLFIPLDYVSKLKKIEATEAFLESVQMAVKVKEQKQEINTCVRTTFSKADPTYLEKKLESLSLLQKERELLEKMIKESSFPSGLSNENRYRFLTSDENRIHFQPSEGQSKEKIEETLETLAHPVEIDTTDLKKILTLIEEKQSGQPELLITDFNLNRKITPNKSEVYELNLQVLKREFPS